MAGAPDAIDRFLANRFPTASPTVASTVPGTNGPQNEGTTPDPNTYGGNVNVQPPAGGWPLGDGSSPGGGGDTAAPSTPALNWRDYLTDWGFPPEVVDELDRIFRTYSDSNAAGAAALGYIRGTQWYASTFPGIKEGMKLGVITNEQDYRSYTNQLNDLYSRYYGRSVTGEDVSSALKAGHNTTWINSRFAGQAWLGANQNEVQYDLGAFDEKGQATPDELQALADQQGGLDNMLGPQLQARLARAKQRLQTVMQGTLATPALSLLQGSRLAAPSLAGGTTQGDVGV